MPLVAFLRGVNVGGHRTFRPSVLARELAAFDVVNVGAAGTFVVRTPGSAARFRAALRARLPFETQVTLCDSRELLRIYNAHSLITRSRPDVTRFVSVLPKPGRTRIATPIALPPQGRWLVRLLASDRQFLFGEYRRDMKTIGCLAQIDALVGAPVTTRNWNTIAAIARVLTGATR
ncbi:MAG TPA: DUF1697 domain-containing protein [Gemmatimonadaceae bacterium]|nr:DUF1697 domain-containing protein [Gemmatimonadaceae bacterium]